MFRRKASRIPPSTPGAPVDETRVRLARGDHDFTTDRGVAMSFVGYDFFDSSGQPRDVGHGEGATEVDPGIWIIRIAGLRHHLPTHRTREVEPLTVVELRSEPSNPVDPNAIAVHLPDGALAGYVPATATAAMPQIVRSVDHVNAVVLGVYSVGSSVVGIRVMVMNRNISFTVSDPD